MYLKFVCALALVLVVHGYIDRKSIAAGFWSIPVGDFDQVNGDIVMALADFNQDRHTDIVTVDSLFMQQISINLWNSTQSVFIKRILKSTLGKPIVSIIPGDFDYDGFTDMMVVYDLDFSYSVEFRLLTDCQTECKMTLLDTENNPFFHGLDKVEPFFLDLDGNRRPDVFLMKNGIRLVLEYSRYEPPPPPPPPPNNNTDNTTSPENTTNNNTKPDNTSANDTTDNKNANARASSLEEGDWILKLNNFSSYIKRKASIEEEVLPPILFNPLKTHFASVVDWTGDCMADLVMMSEGDNAKILEFYKANGDGTLSEPLLYSVPKTVRTFSFSDANFDGAIDLVLLHQEYPPPPPPPPPVQQNTTDPQNTDPVPPPPPPPPVPPLAPAFLEIHHNKYPTLTSQLCVQNQGFPFDMGDIVENTLKKIQRYELAGRMPSDTTPILRFGDLNSDGFPDLLISLTTTVDGVTASNPYLYFNMKCINETCGSYNPAYTFFANVTNMRYYKPLKITTFNVTNSRSLVVYDFFQDGVQDFMINYFEIKKNKQKVHYIASILNNNPMDAFSLKLLCLNGYPTQTKASTNMFGVTYEFKVTTLSGEFRHAVANQQFQLAYQAIQSPNVIVGLGRTNNYVQDLTVGLTQNTLPNYRTWTPIVPHTQLILIPPTVHPSNWTISIYMQPTEKISSVFILTIISLILIGLMIYYFNNKEKVEDRENMTNFYTLLR